MTLENILVAIFLCFLFALLTVGLLFLIKFIIIYPLSCYYTKRGTNKLQWKACETSSSRELRINGCIDEDMISQFYLEWRILPSELPYIVRVYGFNDWESFRQEEYLKFKNEQEFKHFVSDFKTLKDLREYYNKIDDKIVWYEP
ncbi:hypothetical protein IJ182_11860 [bacterium]|nr:hypothetical protein [bacterium]MBQ9246948.1 hypothetical protein [bacterium]